MGREDWNGERFAMLIGEHDIVVEVVLHRERNGGRMGDSYGRFADPTVFPKADKKFSSGEWVFFSRN